MASSTASKNQQFLSQIYTLLVDKFNVTSIDQEVKDKTTCGLGFFVSFFGDLFGAHIDKCLRLLTDRLSNEISRQSALKALTTIARSSKQFSIASVVPAISQHFGEFLRKTNRTLRINTLTLAISIAERSQPGNYQCVDLSSTVVEIPSLLTDKDLQIAQLSLRLMALLVEKYPSQIGNIDPVIKAVIEITKSSLVQGKTQKVLLEFLDAFSRSKVANKPDYREFVSKFMEFVTSWKTFNRPAFLTVAKSIATLSRATEDVSKVLPLTKELEKCVVKGQTLEIKILGMLTIGELGRLFPAVYDDKSSIKPDEIAVNCFKPSCVEDLKMSASQALGSLAVGNIQRYLPFILNQIKEQPTRQYLLVYALRELITSDSVDFANEQLFTSQIDTIWNGIVGQASSTESTRIVVAECLGKLCLTNPKKYLPELVKCFRNSNPLIRCTALVAIRYMICDKPIPADTYLYEILPTFFEGVKDVDIDVRRLAIVLASTVANHKPSLIRDSLKDILPYVYLETTPRKELQREVEMGPFKNLVDDGIELRRSAFECLYNLVEHCLDRVVFHEFVENVEKGLGDTHDIKQLAYLTVMRLTETCPHQIAQHSDAIAETMRTHLQSKPKQNAVKIDNDKQEEMKRMVVRALVALKNMQTHERLPKVNELYELVSKDYAQILAEVRSDVNA